jgi:glycine cleavage system H lipoate-binding protein
MSIVLLALFLVMAIGIGAWLQRRRGKIPQEKAARAKLSSILEGIFVHPGHAWVEVIEPNLVAVGVDEFTKSVFGSVEELALPEPGTVIEQGGKVWKLKRGSRLLAQTSPISGRVEEINSDLARNPQAELKNLLHGNMLHRWNQSVKEHLVASLGLAEFPVLQEGGEIKPDLGNELTSKQWERVTREFFG